MQNKTCGECRKHNTDCFIVPQAKACIYFESKIVTNGDRIKQMSNSELAKLIVPKVIFCDGCPVKCEEKDIPQSTINPFGADVIEDVCTKRVEAWLNAPAESEKDK